MHSRTPSVLRLLAIGLGVLVAYVVAARLGLRLAFVAEQVTTVWAPTGIAGSRTSSVGSFVVAGGLGRGIRDQCRHQYSCMGAIAIATGNTLEASVAASLLLRLSNFDSTLRRVRDALAFVVVGGLLGPAISATIGSVTLCAASVQPWSRFLVLWPDWWLGDTVGALVVSTGPPDNVPRAGDSPGAGPPGERRARPRVCPDDAIDIWTVLRYGVGHHPLEYIIFPFAIVAAVRIGQPATALVVFAALAVAIWNTVHGTGPFAGADMHQGSDPVAGVHRRTGQVPDSPSLRRWRNNEPANVGAPPVTQWARY